MSDDYDDYPTCPDSDESWGQSSLHILPQALNVLPQESIQAAEDIYRRHFYRSDRHPQRTVVSLRNLVRTMTPVYFSTFNAKVDDDGDCAFCGLPVLDHERHIRCTVSAAPYNCAAQALARAEVELYLAKNHGDLMYTFLSRLMVLGYQSGDWTAVKATLQDIPKTSEMLAMTEENKALTLITLFDLLGIGEYRDESEPPF